MIVSVHQPNFFPWLGFFYKIKKSDIFVVLDHVQFTPKSYINRVKILINRNPEWITIPVVKGRKSILFTEICEFKNWRNKLNGTINHAFSKSPKFTDYIDSISKLIHNNSHSLYDFNFEIIKYFLENLQIKVKVFRSSQIIKNKSKGSEMITQICKYCNATTYLSGDGSTDYEDKTKYVKNDIKYLMTNFKPRSYNQFNSSTFIPGLSILDALFNLGFEKLKKYIDD